MTQPGKRTSDKVGKVILWVLLASMLFVGIRVVQFIYFVATREKTAGEQQFNEADKQVIMKHTGSETCHGNTQEARALASQYSLLMKDVCTQAFTGGRKEGGPTLTGDNFLVYAQQNSSEILFLVHVPDFDLYKGDALATLKELSWAAAQKLVNNNPKLKLGLGLRGAIFYGPIMTGTGTGNPTAEGTGVSGEQLLFPFFTPPGNAATAAH